MLLPSFIKSASTELQPPHTLRRCWNPSYLEDQSKIAYDRKRCIKQLLLCILQNKINVFNLVYIENLKKIKPIASFNSSIKNKIINYVPIFTT